MIKLNSLKKFICLLLVVIFCLSLLACEGQVIQGGGNINDTDADTDTDSDDTTVKPPEMNDDPTDDFTVTILADGQPFTPRINMSVYWNDGFSIHTAPVDKTGVARI